jgi:carboxyl-terminal processing protease
MKSIFTLIVLCVLLTGCDGESQNENTNFIANTTEVCSSQISKNQSLWDYLNDWYLWNDTLDQSINLAEFDSLDALLADVRQKNPIDRWSRSVDSQQTKDFFEKGQSIGYGILAIIDEISRELIVVAVIGDSDAYRVGLQRGDRILAIGDKIVEVALSDGSLEQQNLWGAAVVGKSIEIKWRTQENQFEVAQIVQQVVSLNTVMHTQVIQTGQSRVGYMVFHNFLNHSEQELNQAFSYFTESNIDELIIDLRYNGGGSSKIANQLASQIAGDNVYGHIFARYIHNANHSNEDADELFDLYGGTDSLNLGSIVFLTTSNTGSASELLINSLSPHIEVQLVGQRTHGKAAGFKSVEMCDKTIFAVNVAFENSLGFGDYFAGFPVQCQAQDTVPGNWGDMRDPLLKEALYLIDNKQCSALAKKTTNNTAKSVTLPIF